MRLMIAAAVLFVSGVCSAQTPIDVKPKENPVPAGSFAEVVIEGLGTNTDKIVDITPTPVKLVEVGNTIYFSGLEPKYTVEVIAVNFDTKKIFRKKLVVEFAQNPRPPTPVPVDPTDPFAAKLKTAYDQCTESDKAALSAKLADILGNVIPAAKNSGKITTTSQLHLMIRNASDLAIGVDKLKAVRVAIGDYLRVKIGEGEKTIDAGFWTTAEKEYAYVSNTLKGIK